MLDVMRFWLDRAGRLSCDAVPYWWSGGHDCENLPETHAILKEFRAVIDREYGGARLLLAEATSGRGRPFLLRRRRRVPHAFNFPLMPRLYLSLRWRTAARSTDIFTQMPPIPPACQWGCSCATTTS